MGSEMCIRDRCRARVQLKASQINDFILDIAQYNVVDFQEFPLSLEDYFMQFYKEDKVFEGVK